MTDEANRISEDERVARAHTAAAIDAETDMPASDAGETFAAGGIVEPSSTSVLVGENGPETLTQANEFSTGSGSDPSATVAEPTSDKTDPATSA